MKKNTKTHITDSILHKHTPLEACLRLEGGGDCLSACPSVCVAVSGVFAIQQHRYRSLRGRLRIPPVEMKCNVADSIRALPRREKRRESNHCKTPPRLPSIHCCLVVWMEVKQWRLIHLVDFSEGRRVIQHTIINNNKAFKPHADSPFSVTTGLIS